jgi:rRNA maturation RNase YbeY
MIKYFKEDTTFNFKNKRDCNRWIKEVLNDPRIITDKVKLGDINIIFCSDNFILDINNKYLNHNYFTDIITFDYSSENIISGDLIISTDTVRENSVTYNQTFTDELHRVIIHGILHLIGYDDKNKVDKERMRTAEDRALSLRTTIFTVIGE